METDGGNKSQGNFVYTCVKHISSTATFPTPGSLLVPDKCLLCHQGESKGANVSPVPV